SRRALEIGEQESEACYLEPLIWVERVGVIKITKCLIGEESFRGKERPPPAEKMMKRIAGDPERGQHAPVSVVLKRQAQRTGPQLHPAQWGPDLGKHDRQRLPVAYRFALDGDDLPAVGHRIEHDHESLGKLNRQYGFCSGRYVDGIDRELSEAC